MFVQLDHEHRNSSQQALLGFPSKWQAEEQDMRHNPWGQFGHRITTVSAYILRETTRSLFIEQNGWRSYGHASNRTKRRNTSSLDLAQIMYLSPGHMWGRLFERITVAFALHKNHRVA